MNRLIVVLLTLVFFSCTTQKIVKTSKTSLFQVLKSEPDGGANIKFCELLSEPEEIKLLLNDNALKKKIKASDIKTSNFIILNMGEQPTGGYTITVEKAEERADSIVVYVKNIAPEAEEMATQAFTYPYCVVKINSKKGIILK